MRLLLIRPGAIGDFIVSLPTLELLSAGAAYVEVWTSEQNRPLARFANATRSIQQTGLDMLELPARVIEELRGFDRIVSWYGTNRPEFRDEVRRLGIAMEFLPALPPESGVHAVDFFLGGAGNLPAQCRMPTIYTGQANCLPHPR